MKKIFWKLYGGAVKMIFLNKIALRRYGDCFTDRELEILSKVLKGSIDSEIEKKVEAA